ncbi:hypothetical protein [Arcticibacter eurypsychrophilus]|uniref:hypothetical protein n=1 Tax=Arcticibacter eurypsychrophilus TaxID=1434752 RepID=UPI00084DDC10|nr:hypothetical protein [Arcticibacter eurypsychrophilus]
MLKVDDELIMMISIAVSISEVSYVISMVLITANLMMIFMPYIAQYFNFPQEVTGACASLICSTKTVANPCMHFYLHRFLMFPLL